MPDNQQCGVLIVEQGAANLLALALCRMLFARAVRLATALGAFRRFPVASTSPNATERPSAWDGQVPIASLGEEADLTQRQLLKKPQSWVHNCETANRRVDLTEFIAPRKDQEA
jgi:hypothetical protein